MGSSQQHKTEYVDIWFNRLKFQGCSYHTSATRTGGCTSILSLSSEADRIHRKAWVSDGVVQIIHVGLDFIQGRVIQNTRSVVWLLVLLSIFFAFYLFVAIALFVLMAPVRKLAVLCCSKGEGGKIVLRRRRFCICLS